MFFSEGRSQKVKEENSEEIKEENEGKQTT